MINFWKKKPAESSTPNEVDTLIEKGIEFAKSGMSEEALKIFDEVLKIDAYNFLALDNKGLVLYRLGKNEEAITFYDESLKIKPKNVWALVQKGVVLCTLGRFDEGMTCYDEALEIEPEHVHGLYQKGLTLSELGKNDQALVFYDKALKVDPHYVFALSGKATSLSELGKNDQAKACYDELSKINPDFENFLKEQQRTEYREKREPIGNGMIFRFAIRPPIAIEYRKGGLSYLIHESGMLEHFDDPGGKYGDEQDKTIITLEFWKSKFICPMDDPIYKEINEEYIKWIMEFFKETKYSCELLESGVLADMPSGHKIAVYNFDNNASPKMLRGIKDYILDDQILSGSNSGNEKGVE